MNTLLSGESLVAGNGGRRENAARWMDSFTVAMDALLENLIDQVRDRL